MQTDSNDPLPSYVPHPGLSIPIVTVLDGAGNILEDQQRAAVSFCIQDGHGADILFAVGTNGEWDRIDNAHRQEASRIIVDECRRSSPPNRRVEAWVGVTAHTRAETLRTLEYSLTLDADAVVISPLSMRDVDDPVAAGHPRRRHDLRARGKNASGVPLRQCRYRRARQAARICIPRDVKQMSQLPYVRGIKVTASKSELGNYTRAASHFKLAHEFVIYAGNAHLIFDLFAPARGVVATAKHYWNHYLTSHSLPYGVVVRTRESDAARMATRMAMVPQAGPRADASLCEQRLRNFATPAHSRAPAQPYVPMIACLKAALVELGVISSDAIAQGHPAVERRRAPRIRLRASIACERNGLRVLEPEW